MSRSTTRTLIVVATAVLVALLAAHTISQAQTPPATGQFGGQLSGPGGFPTPAGTGTPSGLTPSNAAWSGTPTAGTPTAGTPTAGTPTAGTPSAGTPSAATTSGNGAAPTVPQVDQQLLGTVSSVDQAHSAFTLRAIDGRSLTVIAGAQTEFDDGLIALSSLQAGAAVKVEGIQQADGSLLADKLGVPDQTAGDPQEEELVGTVAGVDQAHATLTLRTPDGHTFTVALTMQTELGDGLTGLAGLQTDTQLKVKAIPQADGSLQADKVELAD